MTEGGIAQWKKKEGESYAAGDVLLEIVSSVLRHMSDHHIEPRDQNRKRIRRLLT